MKKTKKNSPKQKLPLFALPQKVMMFSDDKSSQRQLVTLYNPYDFSIKYRVLSNYPDDYIIQEPEGIVKSRSSMDLILRHKKPHHSDCLNRKDRFKVFIYESYGENKRGAELGIAEFQCSLSANSKENDSKSGGNAAGYDDFFKQVSGVERDGEGRPRLERSFSSASSLALEEAGMRRPSLIYICLVVLCVIGLSVPDVNNKSPTLPWWCHSNENQRLVASYILGLLTIFLLRP